MGRFTDAGDSFLARLLWIAEGQSKGKASKGSTKTCVGSDTGVSDSEMPINRKGMHRSLHFLGKYFVSSGVATSFS